MRHVLVLLACSAAVAASSPLHAQRGLEGKDAYTPKKAATKTDHTRATAPQPPASRPPAHRTPEPKVTQRKTLQDEVREPSPRSVARPQDQRAREPRLTAPPSPKQDRTRYSDIYPQQKSPPSPARQFQQQEFQRQQLQREQAARPQQQAAPRERQGARCWASPVCVRQPGSYGSCQGVEHAYSSEYIGRRDIAARCVQANTPDTCNCAAQCSRVAQCSIF